MSCNGLAMDIVRNPKQTHSLGTSVGVAEEVVALATFLSERMLIVADNSSTQSRSSKS